MTAYRAAERVAVGRPPRSRSTSRRPAARGLTRDEATRALGTFAEEFPQMTRPELYAWLIEKFS